MRCILWWEIVFSSNTFYFKSCKENDLFIENGGFGVFFKPRLHSPSEFFHNCKVEAYGFCIHFLICISNNPWKWFLMLNSVFDIFYFSTFFFKKVMIIMPVLHALSVLWTALGVCAVAASIKLCCLPHAFRDYIIGYSVLNSIVVMALWSFGVCVRLVCPYEWDR